MQRNGSGKLVSKLEGTYEGSWDDDLRHGAGKKVYPNNDVYEGGWEKNKVMFHWPLNDTSFVHSLCYNFLSVLAHTEVFYGSDHSRITIGRVGKPLLRLRDPVFEIP